MSINEAKEIFGVVIVVVLTIVTIYDIWPRRVVVDDPDDTFTYRQARKMKH